MNDQDDSMEIRAVSLLSGGLDSTLAARILMEQGIQVSPLYIRTGLSYARRNRLVGREPTGPLNVEKAAAALGLDLEIIDVSDEFLSVILHPRHGYGSAMNPCVDCRIFLLRQARAWMEEHDHHFVFTGEVLGQRPNSQMRDSLKLVERESGLEGYLLRPLSAKLLEPTIPERRGWVDREKLYGIAGRSRKPQMELAERFGVNDYPQPAGGCCFMVDQNYARRLRDFLSHEGEEALTSERAFLLAIGRHLRLPSGAQVIVGRYKQENAYIKTQGDEGLLLTTVDLPGPTTLMPGEPMLEEIKQAARITARYSDGKNEPTVRVEVRRSDVPSEVLTVRPMPPEKTAALMV